MDMVDAALNRLVGLKVAKDRKGMAPNKPLLVLAILDLVEAGLVGMDGLVHKDAQLNLGFRFTQSVDVAFPKALRRNMRSLEIHKLRPHGRLAECDIINA